MQIWNWGGDRKTAGTKIYENETSPRIGDRIDDWPGSPDGIAIITDVLGSEELSVNGKLIARIYKIEAAHY